MRPIELIVIHCAATPPSADITAADIDRWHRSRGWLGIGYHYVIRRNGKVETGRPLDRAGAHVAGHNSRSIGICLAGGVAEKDRKTPEANFTPEQYAELALLIETLVERFPGAEVLGHRDIPGVAKDCPSFDARSWLKTYRHPTQGVSA